MMLIRPGCDLVSLPHFGARLRRSGERLLTRLFSSAEVDLCKGNLASLAGFYAAKEAFAKALGTGLWAKNALRFTDLEIHKTERGAPFYVCSSRLCELIPRLYFRLDQNAQQANNFQLSQASLSISHDGDYALAFAILQLTAPVAAREGDKESS